MALSKNVKISLAIEVAKSTSDLNALKKSTEELNSALKNAKQGTKEYADIQEALNTSTARQNDLMVEQALAYSETAQGVGQLNKSLKQLKSAQELVDKSSPNFKKLQQAINDTEGRVGDLNDSFKTLTGSGLERFRSSLGLAGEGISNLDWGKFSIGIKGATQAFGGLKAMLGALGLGLIIQAVSYLIQDFGDLKNSTGLLGQVMRGIGDIITSVTSKISEFTDWIGLTNNALENQSNKAIEGAKKTQEAVSSRYDQEIKEAEAAGKRTIDLEREKAKAVLLTLKTQADAIIALGKANGSYTEEQLSQLQELTKQANQIKSDLKVAETKDAKEQEDKRKKSNDDAVKAAKDRAKKEYDELKKGQELALLSVQQGTMEYVHLKQQQYDAEAQFLDKNKKLLEKTELDIQLFRAKAAKDTADSIKAIQDKEVADKKAKQDAEIKAYEEQERIRKDVQKNNEAVEAKALEDFKKRKEEEVRLAREAEMQKIQTASDGVGALMGLSDTYFAIQEANTAADGERAEKNARKQFQINKALQLGMAVIDGFKAVTSSLSQSPVAIGPAPNPAGIASLAFAVTTSAANIAKIAATQYKSSGGAASSSGQSAGAGGNFSPGGTTITPGGGTSGGLTPPQLQRVNGSLPSASGVGSQGQGMQQRPEPLKAYIVAGEIQTAQNKAEILDRKTSF